MGGALDGHLGGEERGGQEALHNGSQNGRGGVRKAGRTAPVAVTHDEEDRDEEEAELCSSSPGFDR